MNEEIKCCPFCGHDLVEVSRTNENACWIECDFCGGQSESAASRKEAIANWNRREEPRAKFAKIAYDMDLEHQERKRIKAMGGM